jgi:hypothetical protein
MPNPEKTYKIISVVVAFLATGCIFLPGWIGLDGMKGGYALSFISFFIAICAVVLAWFFRGRAAELARIFQGKDVLSHWTYTPAEWQNYAEAELNEHVQENKSLWFLVCAICLLVGGLFWIFDHEAGGIVFLVMVATSLLLAVVAFGVPHLHYNRQHRRPGDAWIARGGIFFDGCLVRWNSLEASLEGVEWQAASGNALACLKFELSFPNRTGRQFQALRIPIPTGREAEARSVVEQLTPK